MAEARTDNRGAAPARAAAVLYLSPNPAASALVRSQVIPYLSRLTVRGYDVHLLTFEQRSGLDDGSFPRERWHPVARAPGRQLSAKVADIIRGVFAAVRVARSCQVRVIHARSDLPGAIAWVVSRLTRVPFLFDMRGFLGEEYVEGGVWSEGDPRYVALRWAERLLLRDAAEIVVLTDVAADRLRAEPRYAGLIGRKPVSVVPCAVDLGRFRPASARPRRPLLVYSGSLGTWYLLDEMLTVYAHARALRQDLSMRILNQTESSLIRDAITRHDLTSAPIEVRGATFEEMPALLAEASVGIALIRPVSSKAGSSPIKVAEYLACGLPVIVNEGVGDTPALVRRYSAGHVLANIADHDLRTAANAVVRLLDDHEARVSARRLAEDVFDVDRAAETYARAYARILAPQPIR